MHSKSEHTAVIVNSLKPMFIFHFLEELILPEKKVIFVGI